MPLYDYRDLNGHVVEHFLRADERGAYTVVCDECGSTMVEVPSFGRGLCWFEEGRPRTLWHLGAGPVTVRSPREHAAAMKRAGVTWATRGTGNRGCWV